MIDVAVALILDQEQRLLITQRAHTKVLGGFFEFPGGKIEPDETPESALVREVQEELSLSVVDSTFLGLISHHYPQYSVQLHIFLVTAFRGKPHYCDGQLAMLWVKLGDLKSYNFPEANSQILDLLNKKLPLVPAN